MVGTNDALSGVGELAAVQYLYISAGRHNGRHAVPIDVLCCLTLALWWLEFNKKQKKSKFIKDKV